MRKRTTIDFWSPKYVPENPNLVADCPKKTLNSPITPMTDNSTNANSLSASAGGNNTTVTTPSYTPTNKPVLSGTSTPTDHLVAIFMYGSVSITVPAKRFTTAATFLGASPSADIGVMDGAAPSKLSATATAMAIPSVSGSASASPVPYVIPSSLKPNVRPRGTGAIHPLGTMSTRTLEAAQFTGVASTFKTEARHMMLGAALSFFAV